jgi:hypothetical protein
MPREAPARLREALGDWLKRGAACVRTAGALPLWSPGPLPVILGRLAAALGIAAAGYYALEGLTLAHYDAKAHLVVSRRILDSLTPGWQQIGAVWLPLPHLIQMLPVQIDHLYRTGTFAVAISVLSHALATASIAAVILALTRSRAGAVLAAAVYATNPNVLYLQSTPMTEPLLFGLSVLQVHLFTVWVLSGRLTVPRGAGCVTVLACLTRYEAWPITAACYAASAFAWWRRGRPAAQLVPVYARLSLYPVLTVLGFMLFSQMTVGEWFVSSGFFVPDDSLRGQPAVVVARIADGVRVLSTVWLLAAACLSALVVAVLGITSAGRSPMLVPLSLFASAALPFAAYMAGHPFRLRYEIPLVVASAVAVGLAVGLLRRLAPYAAVALLMLVVASSPPFDRAAPMVLEAQLDRNRHAREHVTACLRSRYEGGTLMVSMGALAHYMHELSAAGFVIRDFLHEGNNPMWSSALARGPAALVEWVVVEEAAEGGDVIAQRSRVFPTLLEGYERVCAGGNVTVYRRTRGLSAGGPS